MAVLDEGNDDQTPAAPAFQLHTVGDQPGDETAAMAAKILARIARCPVGVVHWFHGL